MRFSRSPSPSLHKKMVNSLVDDPRGHLVRLHRGISFTSIASHRIKISICRSYGFSNSKIRFRGLALQAKAKHYLSALDSIDVRRVSWSMMTELQNIRKWGNGSPT